MCMCKDVIVDGRKYVVKNCVRSQRLLFGWTQSMLAAHVGVSKNTISSIEKGDCLPSIGLAIKLAIALEESLDDLFWLYFAD